MPRMVLIVRGHMIRENVKLLSMKKKRKSKRDVYLKKVGRTIREARKAKGMSQESLAFASGLDRSYVGGVERGERNIAILNLKRIAEALQVPVSSLLKGL